MTDSTPISSIGEFGLIEKIRSIVEQSLPEGEVDTSPEGGSIGIGDDAALFQPRPGRSILLTTDVAVEGIHFDLTYTSLRHLGWKAMVANLSDIAAMGGEPRYAVVTIVLPAKITVEMVEDLYIGAYQACREYGCRIVGGDTSTSLGNMMISIAMVGDVAGKPFRRADAQVGDLLCVSGYVGSAHAGLKILQREKQRFLESRGENGFRPNLEPYKDVIERHLMPRPQFDLARALRRAGVHAVIDVSDGISSDAHRIAESSHVGMEIIEEDLPIHPVAREVAAEFGDSAVDYALFGGEDYELLFTIPREAFDTLQAREVTVALPAVSVIGRILDGEEGLTLVSRTGTRGMLPAGGWDHFSH